MRFIYSIVEGIKIAFHALRTNKVRAFLTTLCIIIGITMVTIVDAVTTGMDETFDKSMAMMGQNVIYVEKRGWNEDGSEWWKFANRRELDVDYVDYIKDYSRYASNVSASANRGTSIRYKDKQADGVFISGVTDNYLSVQGLNIDRGRMFTAEEGRSGSKVAVIGETLREALFEQQSALGKEIRFRGQKYIVIGVLEKQGSFLGLQDTDNRIIIPINAYAQIFSLRGGLQIGVQFANEEAMKEGEYEIEGLMRRVRQLDAAERNDFAINKPEAFKEQLEGIKTGLYFGGFALVGLSLLIGGVGIMNIMFVSVRERTKEIGIRKAVGAKSWEIMSQFLIEAVVICMMGGVIGVAIAGLAVLAIDQVFTARMNFDVIFVAFSLCTFVGLLFGFIPAYKAAKADPIESLRFD